MGNRQAYTLVSFLMYGLVYISFRIYGRSCDLSVVILAFFFPFSD